MSLHSQLSPEAEERFQKQRRNSTLASFLIAFLVIALIGALLAFILINVPIQKIDTLVSYVPPQAEEEVDVITPKVQTNISKMPTPPAAASAVTSVITSSSLSSVSIPTSDTLVNTESLDFGQTDDFGEFDSFDVSESFDGAMENGQTSFFGAKVTGNRICYVIDYSKSMGAEGGIRDKLMREELTKSIDQLKGSNVEFSLIFFAGPVWQSGDEVIMTEDERAGEVIAKDDGGSYQWLTDKTDQDWHTDGDVQKFTWRKPSARVILHTIDEIEETPLVFGTRWDNPLSMAYELDPKPDVIIFMTDGATGKDQEDYAEDFAKQAKRKKIVINAIALMQPMAAEGMISLADKTGGTATMVLSEGEIVDLMTGEPVVTE